MKTCTKCGLQKSDDLFYKDAAKKGGYNHSCKVCMDINRAANIAKDPEKDKQARRNTRFKHIYGITLDDYNQLFLKQEGCCAICGKHQMDEDVDFNSKKPRALAVDHCHTTGNVRGLLCGKCNKGIGLFNDDKDMLRSAIKYLEK